MTPDAAPGPSGGQSLRIMRVLASIAALAGAIGSLALLIAAGHRSPQRVLFFLFVLWVLSPFATFFVTLRLSRRWPATVRSTLYAVILIVTALSVAIYGRLFPRSAHTAPAFVWVMVPLGSWLSLAIAIALSALWSRRRSTP